MLKSVLALLLCAAMGFNSLFMSAGAVSSETTNSPEVVGIVSDKAMYAPGETATFSISLNNENGTAWSGPLYVKISHLENNVALLSSAISVEGNSQSTVNMQWTVPQDDFTGYLVKVYIDESYATTALDCSSDFMVY